MSRKSSAPSPNYGRRRARTRAPRNSPTRSRATSPPRPGTWWTTRRRRSAEPPNTSPAAGKAGHSPREWARSPRVKDRSRVRPPPRARGSRTRPRTWSAGWVAGAAGAAMVPPTSPSRSSRTSTSAYLYGSPTTSGPGSPTSATSPRAWKVSRKRTRSPRSGGGRSSGRTEAGRAPSPSRSRTARSPGRVRGPRAPPKVWSPSIPWGRTSPRSSWSPSTTRKGSWSEPRTSGGRKDGACVLT